MPALIASFSHLHFKCEVFLEVLDDHDQKRQLDAQSLAGIGRTCHIGGAGGRERHHTWSHRAKRGGVGYPLLPDITAHNLQHQRLDVIVCDPLYVAISHLFTHAHVDTITSSCLSTHIFVPDLQGLAAYAIEH